MNRRGVKGWKSVVQVKIIQMSGYEEKDIVRKAKAYARWAIEKEKREAKRTLLGRIVVEVVLLAKIKLFISQQVAKHEQ